MDNFTSRGPLEMDLAASIGSGLTLLPLLLSAPVVSTLIVTYVLTCLAFRFQRSNQIREEFSNRPLSEMTDNEAHSILNKVSELEFPALYEKGLQLALFRTYGIPSISKLLAGTTQLSSSRTVDKRYADTTALVVEMYGNAPTSERGREAFARLNFLHENYIRKGLITNDDMLYTLALFMNHPVEWINRFEWRQLTDVEICAFGVFHCSMGDAMKIDFKNLPSCKSGWRDGIHFFRELDSWAKQYEERFMVPDQKNYETATQTKYYLSKGAPAFSHAFIGSLMTAAMDDRLRQAIKFEKPNQFAVVFLNGFMTIRRALLRYLALPRPGFLRSRLTTRTLDKDNRIFFNYYTTSPHYVKPTIWNRWGPSAWSRRMMSLDLPGDKGMYPEGFRTRDVGPSYFVGKGSDEIDSEVMRLSRNRTGGCPFSVAR